ncbi:MAG TPA: cold shock domain-containing protein [Actinomycetota bacterium]
MAQGTVKDYLVEERTGAVLLDDHSEVLIDQDSAEGSGIRYLRVGQRVDFDIVEEGNKRLARNLRIVTFS